MEKTSLAELLERLYEKYDVPEFIENDPISIPHMFVRREDVEISGFLASTIAWGNRKAIVGNARRMMEYMDRAPYDFVMGASEGDLNTLHAFVHRTFNGGDLVAFIRSLRRIYTQWPTMGDMFEQMYARSGDMRQVLSGFRREFFSTDHPPRCEKHISSIDKKAACKRLNMFLRWMIRVDERGVDLGLWTAIPASALYLPLDVHAGNMGRALGLLGRRQNDWKAVEEITCALREFDPADPVKYDFALFGAGIDGFLK